jgi:hypothetical protein
MHYVHLLEVNRAGTTVWDLDLGNSTGTSPYFLVDQFQPGEPRFKITRSSSPLVNSYRLTSITPDATETTMLLGIKGTSPNNMQKELNILDRFCKHAMDAQVARSNFQPTNDFFFAVKPSGATRTSMSRIIEMSLVRPSSYLGAEILSNLVEGFRLRIKHSPDWSATEFNIFNAVSRNNGYDNAITINKSTTPFIEGDQDTPLRFRVDGNNSNAETKRLLIAVRYAEDPADLQEHLWAKDAALSNNTVGSGTDTALDGNNTDTGTITTAADTDEHLTHRWTIGLAGATYTKSTLAQYGNFRAFGVGKRSAAVYSVRARLGLKDASSNIIYPDSGGYVQESDELVSIGAHSGNELALFDLGVWRVPQPWMDLASVYQLVYELYTTCSDTTGGPTFTLDDIFLMPLMEGAQDTGYVDAVYPIGVGVTGVSGFAVDAIPGTRGAYVIGASSAKTFGGTLRVGAPLLAHPNRKGVVYFALVDPTNSQINRGATLTISVDYELRHGGLVGE